MFDEFKNHDFAIYAGYATDDTKLLQSTSGGIATALGEYVISEGGYVAGVAYDSDFQNAEYIIVNDMDGLKRLRGSKYVDAKKGTVYAEVKKLLSQGAMVLFVGVPCSVAALHKMVGRPDNLFSCELICHGPTLPKVHQDFVNELEEKYNSKITEFSVRYKENSWLPTYLRAKFENGQEFKRPFYETDYGFAFGVLGKEGCYSCPFRGNNRTADIMIGDYWGATKSDLFWNDRGVSVIFAETKKGNALLKKLPNFKLFDTDFESAVKENQMVIYTKKKDPRMNSFKRLLDEKGLHYAVTHTRSRREQVKSAVKKLVPQGLVPMAKKIYRMIKK